MWPFLLRKIFGPSSVPKKFEGFPEEMAVRPSQLRAAAAESALMIGRPHSMDEISLDLEPSIAPAEQFGIGQYGVLNA
jgi:hypothetical protein